MTHSQESRVSSSQDTFQLPEEPTSSKNPLCECKCSFLGGRCANAKIKPPGDTEKENAAPVFPWLVKFSEQSRNLIGIKNMKALERLLNTYTELVTPNVEECYQRPNRAAKLRRIMNSTLVFFHLLYLDIGEPLEEHSPYLDKMSDLVAMYLDMEVIAAVRKKETVLQIVGRCLSCLNVLLEGSKEHILEAILKTKHFNKPSMEICLPILRRILNEHHTNPLHEGLYIRYILVFKLWTKIVAVKDRPEIVKLANERLVPPVNFLERVKLLNTILPKVPKCKKKKVTVFLMEAKFNIQKSWKAFQKMFKDPKRVGLPIKSKVLSFYSSALQPQVEEKADEIDEVSSSNLMNDIWFNLQKVDSVISSSSNKCLDKSGEGAKKKCKDKSKKEIGGKLKKKKPQDNLALKILSSGLCDSVSKGIPPTENTSSLKKAKADKVKKKKKKKPPETHSTTSIEVNTELSDEEEPIKGVSISSEIETDTDDVVTQITNVLGNIHDKAEVTNVDKIGESNYSFTEITKNVSQNEDKKSSLEEQVNLINSADMNSVETLTESTNTEEEETIKDVSMSSEVKTDTDDLVTPIAEVIGNVRDKAEGTSVDNKIGEHNYSLVDITKNVDKNDDKKALEEQVNLINSAIMDCTESFTETTNISSQDSEVIVISDAGNSDTELQVSQGVGTESVMETFDSSKNVPLNVTSTSSNVKPTEDQDYDNDIEVIEVCTPSTTNSSNHGLCREGEAPNVLHLWDEVVDPLLQSDPVEDPSHNMEELDGALIQILYRDVLEMNPMEYGPYSGAGGLVYSTSVNDNPLGCSNPVVAPDALCNNRNLVEALEGSDNSAAASRKLFNPGCLGDEELGPCVNFIEYNDDWCGMPYVNDEEDEDEDVDDDEDNVNDRVSQSNSDKQPLSPQSLRQLQIRRGGKYIKETEESDSNNISATQGGSESESVHENERRYHRPTLVENEQEDKDKDREPMSAETLRKSAETREATVKISPLQIGELRGNRKSKSPSSGGMLFESSDSNGKLLGDGLYSVPSGHNISPPIPYPHVSKSVDLDKNVSKFTHSGCQCLKCYNMYIEASKKYCQPISFNVPDTTCGSVQLKSSESTKKTIDEELLRKIEESIVEIKYKKDQQGKFDDKDYKLNNPIKTETIAVKEEYKAEELKLKSEMMESSLPPKKRLKTLALAEEMKVKSEASDTKPVKSQSFPSYPTMPMISIAELEVTNKEFLGSVIFYGNNKKLNQNNVNQRYLEFSNSPTVLTSDSLSNRMTQYGHFVRETSTITGDSNYPTTPIVSSPTLDKPVYPAVNNIVVGSDAPSGSNGSTLLNNYECSGRQFKTPAQLKEIPAVSSTSFIDTRVHSPSVPYSCSETVFTQNSTGLLSTSSQRNNNFNYPVTSSRESDNNDLYESSNNLVVDLSKDYECDGRKRNKHHKSSRKKRTKSDSRTRSSKRHCDQNEYTIQSSGTEDDFLITLSKKRRRKHTAR